MKVAVIMGSKSDLKAVAPAIQRLKEWEIPFEAHVLSAHRTPHAAAEFSAKAKENGFGVIIAAAGKAAHLAGVLAACTTLPVIAVPIKSSTLDGLDSLLSMVQMPKGIPVGTMAIDGADNAGIYAAQILALNDTTLAAALDKFKEKMAKKVLEKDEEIRKMEW